MAPRPAFNSVFPPFISPCCLPFFHFPFGFWCVYPPSVFASFLLLALTASLWFSFCSLSFFWSLSSVRRTRASWAVNTFILFFFVDLQNPSLWPLRRVTTHLKGFTWDSLLPVLALDVHYEVENMTGPLDTWLVSVGPLHLDFEPIVSHQSSPASTGTHLGPKFGVLTRRFHHISHTAVHFCVGHTRISTIQTKFETEGNATSPLRPASCTLVSAT